MSYSTILEEIKNVLMDATNGTKLFGSTFEDGTLDNFSAEGGLDTGEASTEKANTGSYSAKIIEAESTFLGVTRSASVVTGRTYIFEAYVYTDSTLSDVRFIEELGENTNPTVQGQWHKVTLEFTGGATASQYFRLQVRNGATAYFDDVRLFEHTGTPNQVGVVYDYIRRPQTTKTRDWKLVTESIFHVWFITRNRMPAIAGTSGQVLRDHTFQLIGYYQVDDTNASEKTFQELCDIVMDEFDTTSNLQLNNTAEQLQAAQLIEFNSFEERFSVICHEAIIEIVAIEEVGL